MSTTQDIPKPPEDATDREKLLWQELINRIYTLKTGARENVTEE